MKSLSRIVGINLIILAIYTLIIHFSNTLDHSNDAFLGILILSILPIAIHVIVNIIIAIVFFAKNNLPMGKAFLLSALVVLIIGFSTCWGSAMVAVM